MRLLPLAFAARLMLMLAVFGIAFNLLILGLNYRAAIVVLLCFLAYRRMRRWRGPCDAHGSARSSGFADLLRAGLLDEDGLMMGDCRYLARPSRTEGLRWLFSPLVPSPLACKLFLAAWVGGRWARDITIRIKDFVHIGTFAPAGAGKGVSAVIPTLRSYRGSVVVTDPKGENYNITGEFRQSKFRHRVIRLDPFNVCGPGGGALNPLDFLPPPSAPDFLDTCRDLANSLVVRTGTETDPYWNERAEQMICGIICFVAAVEKNPKLRNLLSVRRILGSQNGFLATVNLMRTRCGGVVQRMGEMLAFSKPGTEEFAGVMAMVQRHTAWMDSDAVATCLAQSSFHPDELRAGRLSVYFILPPERLETLAPLMRMWLATTLGQLARGQASESNRVMFIVDEAAHLGRLRPLENALTLLRGYGIRCWLFYQSLGQLQEVYGNKAQVVLDNLGTQQFFGTNSYASSEEVSKRIGEMTVAGVSVNESRSSSRPTGHGKDQSGNVSTSYASTWSEHGRRWATAAEILTLPLDYCMLMHRNMHVIPTGLVRYYDSPLFRRGRTGHDRGLGLGSTVAATAVYLASWLFSDVVTELATLPLPMLAPPPAAVRAGYRRLPGRPVYPRPIR